MPQRRLTTKATLLIADAILHLAVLAWFVAGRAPVQLKAQTPTSELAMFDLPTAQAAASPAPQAPPKAGAAQTATPAALAPSETPPPLSIEQQVVAILGDRAAIATPIVTMPASASASSDNCDLTVPVQSALSAEPEALALAMRLPRSSLSIANGYMLWNAGWVSPRHAPETALAEVKRIIVARIAAAPAACLDSVQTGPRFIVVGPRSLPLTLVIGSGEWRWGDLMEGRDDVVEKNLRNMPLAAI